MVHLDERQKENIAKFSLCVRVGLLGFACGCVLLRGG